MTELAGGSTITVGTSGTTLTAWKEPWRRGVARVLYSPSRRFRSIVFEADTTKRFGRDERADVCIADHALKGSHFEVYFDGLRFHAKDLSGEGIAVDGRTTRFGEIRSGGFVVAGHTTLGLYTERFTPPADDVGFDHLPALLGVLGPARDAGSLYGVFDSARDPRIIVLLNESIEEHASLYEGDKAAVLDDVAPYMVKFAPDSRLLERLLAEGWGKSWGLYLIAPEPWKIVRRQLRRFLMVLDEGANERMYFRFYDPRVMREFHSVATPRQRAELLHGTDRMIMEAEDGSPIVLQGTPSQESS